jgi:hypothetical protein
MRPARVLSLAALAAPALVLVAFEGCRAEIDRVFDDELEAGALEASIDAAAVAPDASGGPADGSSPDTGVPGACGTCDTSTVLGAPSCDGTRCVFTCKPDRVNCKTDAPDTDGCECAGTACCSNGSCQTAHANGTGQTFFDCQPLGTFTRAQAAAACTAFAGDASACTTITSCPGNSGTAVCSTAPSCRCWKYEAGNSGFTGRVSSGCSCPAIDAPVWN